jgi:DNA polymerase-3 subunit gamma/tau
MAQQALYRKWRSRSFDELIGQPHVVQTLQNALESGRIAHAYLFSGPRGTGKTSSARILAKAVNCLAPEGQRPCNECALCRSITDGSAMDLIEIDAASNTQVDKVRDVIVEKINFAPSEARRKVYIIDEVHMLSNSAFNALLKTLEEPPPHAMFILATTEIHKVPATILSRCQRLDFRRIGVQEVSDHLAWVLGQEGVTADADVLELVARQGTGSMRDALSLLDQLLAYGGDHLTMSHARAALGLASSESVQGLVDHLLAHDTANALKLVGHLLDQGTDPRQFLVDVLDYLRSLLLTMAGGGQRLIDLPDEQFARLRQQMRFVNPPALMEVIRLFNQAGADLKLGLQPQLPLELAIVESILKLQEQGMTAAPHADLPLPERPQPPQIVREPRVVKLPLQETEASPPDLISSQEAEPIHQTAEPAPQAHVESQVSLGRGEPEPSLTQATHDTDESQEDDILWDGGSLAEANEVYETDDSDIEEAEEEPLAPSISLDWWQANWEPFKQFLAKQGEQGQRAMLRLKWGDPIAATADSLTLGFGYTMHLEKVQKPEEKSVIERALGKFSNRPIKLISQQISRNAPPTTPTKNNRFEAAAGDPVVQEALRQGGQIVDVLTPKE